jgi:succinyl-diaminopimelate desuccinylase
MWRDLIDTYFDRDFLLSKVQEFIRIPTDPDEGRTQVAPDDPKLTRFVREALQPVLRSIGARDHLVDPWNNVIVRQGKANARTGLLVLTYCVVHHGNRMSEPYSGRIANGRAYGHEEDCVFGRGASESKGALAAALAALKLVLDSHVELKRSLVWALSTEGRSSHFSTSKIIDGQKVQADGGIACIGTGGQITLGNRGRLDLVITIKGKSSHSSQPWLAHSAIDGGLEAVRRLKAIPMPRVHPLLGPEQLTIYKMICSPIAPHTIPDTCEITVDRRLLPESDLGAAVEEVRDALAGMSPFDVSVEEGVLMYPAEVAPDASIVAALSSAHREITGRDPERTDVKWTFDAGYPCRAGIPTVCYGPASAATAAEDPLGVDFVTVRHLEETAKIYAHTMLQMLAKA